MRALWCQVEMWRQTNRCSVEYLCRFEFRYQDEYLIITSNHSPDKRQSSHGKINLVQSLNDYIIILYTSSWLSSGDVPPSVPSVQPPGRSESRYKVIYSHRKLDRKVNRMQADMATLNLQRYAATMLTQTLSKIGIQRFLHGYEHLESFNCFQLP
jgi:hypothetical protein